MLTIKPPIKLRCQTELTAIHQDMDEKIRSNYSLMNESIRREELLYLTTSTPDMYFSEGSNTNVLNEITTQSRQEFRLDVINNLVNRIMVSNTENFSYQDSVYISNVLRKIGITDVNSFMKQVSLLQSETKQTNRLLSLYEDNRQMLTKLFEQGQGRGKAEKEKEPENAVAENRYYLHEEIFNRLSTGKIYQEITAFTNASARTENYITHNQMSVAEQTMQSKNFRLQELKTNVFQKAAPMNFYHANTYELADTEEKTVAQQDERLTPAILLNLVDQAYSIKSQSIEQNSHRWYNLVTSLYESARNTIQRFDSYRRDGVYNTTQLNEAIVSINEQRKAEVNALTRISNEFSDVSFAIRKYENNLGISFEEISRRFEEAENVFQNKEISERSYSEDRHTEDNRQYSTKNVLEEKVRNTLNMPVHNSTVEQGADIAYLSEENHYEAVDNTAVENKTEFSSKTENVDKTKQELTQNISSEQMEYIQKLTSDVTRNYESSIQNNLESSTTLINRLSNSLEENVLSEQNNIETTLSQDVSENKEYFLQSRNEAFVNRNQYSEDNNTYNNADTTVLNNAENVTEAEISYLVTENEQENNNLTVNSEVRNIDNGREYHDVSSQETKITRNSDIRNENSWESVRETNQQTFNSENTSVENQTRNVSAEYQNSVENREITAFSLLENILKGEVISNVYQSSRETQDNRQYNSESYGYQPVYNEGSIEQYYGDVNVSESADISYLTESESENTEMSAEDKTKEIEKQISRINEQNIEKLQKMQEIESKRPAIKDITIDKKKARQNLLRSLENPEEVIKEITEKSTESSVKEINRKVTNEIYENFSEEAKQVYEQVMNTPGSYEAKNFIQNFFSMGSDNPENPAEETGSGEQTAESREQAWMRLSEDERSVVRSILNIGAEDRSFVPEQLKYVTGEELPAEEEIPLLIQRIINKNKALHQDIRTSQVIENHPEYLREDITYKDVVDMYLSQPEEAQRSEAEDRIEKAMPSVITNYIRNEFVKNDEVQSLIDNVIFSNEIQNEINSVSRNTEIHPDYSVVREGDRRTFIHQEFPEKVQNEIESVALEHITESIEHQTDNITSEIHSENRISEERINDRIEKQIRQTFQSEIAVPEALKLDFASNPSEETSRNLETRIIEEVIRNQVNMERLLPVSSTRTDSHRSVSLVHKEENHEIDEELLNRIQSRSENTVREETVINKDVISSDVIETNKLQQINHVTNAQIENIEEIVSRQVRSQMGSISDQVMGKIERRLADERRRHGY